MNTFTQQEQTTKNLNNDSYSGSSGSGSTSNNSNKKLIGLIGVLVIFTVGMASLAFSLNKQSNNENLPFKQVIQEDNNENSISVPLFSSPTPATISVSLSTAEQKWEIGKTYPVYVELPRTIKTPIFTTVELIYDPKTLKAEKALPGDLWDSQNTLLNKVDPSKSIVQYHAGQGFDAQITGGTQVAIFNFTVLNIPDEQFVTFQVSGESSIVHEGSDHLNYLSTEQLVIEIKR